MPNGSYAHLIIASKRNNKHTMAKMRNGLVSVCTFVCFYLTIAILLCMWILMALSCTHVMTSFRCLSVSNDSTSPHISLSRNFLMYISSPSDCNHSPTSLSLHFWIWIWPVFTAVKFFCNSISFFLAVRCALHYFFYHGGTITYIYIYWNVMLYWLRTDNYIIAECIFQYTNKK